MTIILRLDNALHALLKPSTFFALSGRLKSGLCLITLISTALGLYWALVLSPADYRQGEMVRMMYVHVPASWLALGVYTFMASLSAIHLIWKNPFVSLIVKAAAPIGLCFALLSLVTGSLWGKPTWGAWWVWDARLTSMLILFFLYAGYLLLVQSFENTQHGQQVGSILLLVGALNIPIIKFSVNWWYTLHQPASLFKWGKPAVHPSMMLPLMLMLCAFIGYFLLVLILRVEKEWAAQKLKALQIRIVQGGR